MYEYLDRRYALALYEVAEEKGKVEEYLNDLREICNIIETNKEFYEVIKHPQINTRKKKQTFINIFKGQIDEELLSFLLILIEKDRILYLREKLNEMEKIDLERKNTLRGTIKTAVPLLPEELEKLKEIIADQLNVDAAGITAESRFKEDLEADSLDLFELVMSLEEEYGVEIPSEDLEKILTVGDVIKYLEDKGVEA